MSIVLAVFTDGRDDLLAQTLRSADEHLQGPITRRVIFDDTGDIHHLADLGRRFPGYKVRGCTPRQGFGGAIRATWEHLTLLPISERFVLHLEDDQTFNRYVDLAEMSRVLDEQPNLAQLALRRQAWNAEERSAGGVVEAHPDAYAEVTDGGATWLEHRLFFTTNASLYRRSLCERGWPEGEHSEGRFSIDLFADPEVRCGYWGSRDSGEWITHTGLVRAGHGY